MRIFILIFCLGLAGCHNPPPKALTPAPTTKKPDQPQLGPKTPPTPEPPITTPDPSITSEPPTINLHMAKKLREAFKDTPVKANKPQGHLYNAEMHNRNARGDFKFYPKAPVLYDDPSSRMHDWPDLGFIAKLGSAFEEKLPQSVRDMLSKYGLLNKEAVDIFWVAQGLNVLGEAEDHGGIPTTTRIKPHGWADPDAPTQYIGDRVNRNFLLGIFEAKPDVATAALPRDTMVPTKIHTHDGYFSPREASAMVKISSHSPSQSFWSLVIDTENPEGKIRAVATLHWLYNDDIRTKLEHIKPNERAKFEDVLKKLNTIDSLKNTEMLERLNALFE